MSISKEAVEAAQRAWHELDEGGCSIEKCWEAALQAGLDANKASQQPVELPYPKLKDVSDPLAEGYWTKGSHHSLENKYLNISMFVWAAFLNTWRPDISQGPNWKSLPLFDRFMRELVASLQHCSPERESGWQPIETAPRETEVLVADSYANRIKTATLKHIYGTSDYEWDAIFINPTHWMSLPLAPISEIEDGDSK